MESVLRCTRSWPWGGNFKSGLIFVLVFFFVIGKVTDPDDTSDIKSLWMYFKKYATSGYNAVLKWWKADLGGFLFCK